MTKQFLLMANLIESFQEKVDFDSWIRLDETINANREEFYNIILVDDGPKRKEKAEAALLRLTETLRRRLDQEMAA